MVNAHSQLAAVSLCERHIAILVQSRFLLSLLLARSPRLDSPLSLHHLSFKIAIVQSLSLPFNGILVVLASVTHT